MGEGRHKHFHHVKAGCLKAIRSNNQMILKSTSSGRALVRAKQCMRMETVPLNELGKVECRVGVHGRGA